MFKCRIPVIINKQPAIILWLERVQKKEGFYTGGIMYDVKGKNSYDRSTGDRCYSTWVFKKQRDRLIPVRCLLYGRTFT